MTAVQADLEAFLEHDLRPHLAHFAHWYLIDEMAAMLTNELKAIGDGVTEPFLRALRDLRLVCEYNIEGAKKDAVSAARSRLEEGE